ncbi:hypothetical protein BD311DRAFT_770581 [Dichomitus squalens]|uniref:Uncharacterized protein n=1 Tax=Dichomitus squalens TaxID=114155 RepID=A0A4Q9M603_9APHY|nr:hypothetical protein BD311DRAFT_770581 [Dichomitus squalens]
MTTLPHTSSTSVPVMDAKNLDSTTKPKPTPLRISPIALESKAKVQQTVGRKPVIEFNQEELPATSLHVPPPSPTTMRHESPYDAQRFHYSRKSALASPIIASGPFPTPTVPGFATGDLVLPDSIVFQLPVTGPEHQRPPRRGQPSDDTNLSRSIYGSSASTLVTPDDDYVEGRIIRPQRSRPDLRRPFSNLRKARSMANLPKMPGLTTFGRPYDFPSELSTPVDSSDSLTNTTSTRPASRFPSRRPSLANLSLSSPVPVTEVAEALCRLVSDLRGGSSVERHFNEAVSSYEKACALADSGEGVIEVRVDEITETCAETCPAAAKARPDGIGLYSRPRSRKDTMPAVVERARGQVWV